MKIRVLKELPWANEGRVIELHLSGVWDAGAYWGVSFDMKALKIMAEKGWVEFVEEKNTLGQKLEPFVFEAQARKQVIEICRQNFLDALPKANYPITPISDRYRWVKEGIDRCHKAIQEVE